MIFYQQRSAIWSISTHILLLLLFVHAPLAEVSEQGATALYRLGVLIFYTISFQSKKCKITTTQAYKEKEERTRKLGINFI